MLPSVLWRCWLGGRKGIRTVKTEWWGADVVICLDRGADLHMAQLMPLPLTVSCFSKIQIGFTFLVPAYPGSPEQQAFKRVCVCVFYTAASLSHASTFIHYQAKSSRLTLVSLGMLHKWMRMQRQRMPLICRHQSNAFILGLIIVPNDRQIRTTEHGRVSDVDGRAWGYVVGGVGGVDHCPGRG